MIPNPRIPRAGRIHLQLQTITRLDTLTSPTPPTAAHPSCTFHLENLRSIRHAPTFRLFWPIQNTTLYQRPRRLLDRSPPGTPPRGRPPPLDEKQLAGAGPSADCGFDANPFPFDAIPIAAGGQLFAVSPHGHTRPSPHSPNFRNTGLPGVFHNPMSTHPHHHTISPRRMVETEFNRYTSKGGSPPQRGPPENYLTPSKSGSPRGSTIPLARPDCTRFPYAGGPIGEPSERPRIQYHLSHAKRKMFAPAELVPGASSDHDIPHPFQPHPLRPSSPAPSPPAPSPHPPFPRATTATPETRRLPRALDTRARSFSLSSPVPPAKHTDLVVLAN